MGAVKEFVLEVLGDLRVFARECLSQEAMVLLGYTLVLCTHHVLLDNQTTTAVLAPYLPYASDWMIRKDFLDVVLFGGLVPLLIVLVHRQNPINDYGLKLPNRRWTLFTAAIFAGQLVGILIAARIPSLRDYYPMFQPARKPGPIFWQFQALAFLSMVSWEFINRGYLLFGLKKRLGYLAVIVQTVPFALLHFGKPTIELYWSIADGIGLALLAYACGSIWPSVWLHGVGAFLLDVTLVYIFPR
jgi:hypothetical protein